MWGLIQISGHAKPVTFLLQSKVARHGSPDHYISHVKRFASQPGGTRFFSAARWCLHTVHAIASCNAAEIAIGMLIQATVPTSHLLGDAGFAISAR
jgi:hypothetical protein